MFADSDAETVGFPSSWERVRRTETVAAQTKESSQKERATQTHSVTTSESQTEPERKTGLSLADADTAVLGAFLRRVEGVVCEQLKLNVQSHAFDGYDVQWEEAATSVSCTHVLRNGALDESATMPITGVAWNCAGSVVAAASGRVDHQDWCTHRSHVCTWSIDRRGIDRNRPDMSLDVPGCAMALAFHPEFPSWLACGTFNGDVIVWDLSRDDDPVLCSSARDDDRSHREAVTGLAWLEDGTGSAVGGGGVGAFTSVVSWKLLTTGADGRAVLWHVPSRAGSRLEPLRQFALRAEGVARDGTYGGRRARENAELGATCVGIASREDKSNFIVGTENGGVFKCSLNPRGRVAIQGLDSDAVSPIVFAFAPHAGPAYGADCSPFHRNLFITCSTDGSVHLYSQLQSKPILTMDVGLGAVFAVGWSPARPLVFAGVTSEGRLFVYDLKANRNTPTAVFDAAPPKHAAQALAFNARRPQLLATGDSAGNLRVWRLSDEFVLIQGGETARFRELARTGIDA